MLTEVDADETLARFLDAFNSGFPARLLEQFAPDASVIGAGGCKGRACSGRQEILARYVGATVGAIRTDTLVRVGIDGDVVVAAWRCTVLEDGSRTRGTMRLTVRDGAIAAMSLRYDLTDPASLLFRTRMGEVVVGLHESDASTRAVAYAIFGEHDDGVSVSVLLQPETRATHCEMSGHELNPIGGDRSETLLPRLALHDVARLAVR